jgi:hypothetical protein
MQSEDSTATMPVHYERQAVFSYDSLGNVRALQLISSELAGDLVRTIAVHASFDSIRPKGTRSDGVLRIQPTLDSTGAPVLTSRVEVLEERPLTERELAATRRVAEALWHGPCRNVLVAR